MAKKLITALLAALALAAVLAGGAQAAEREYYLGFHPPTAAERPGNVLMIHGGGWEGDLGADADQVMSTYIADVQSWGYGVYNIGYRSGADSLRDVVDATGLIAKRKSSEPLCLIGGSAGAQLALIAAIRRRSEIDCVIDIGGPPDLVVPDTQPLSSAVVDLATAAFGAKRLERLSPINRVAEIRQPVLVVAPDCDSFTSLARQQAFAAALRRGELFRELQVTHNPTSSNPLSSLLSNLGFGFMFAPTDPGVETGHCAVTRASFDAFRAAERGFLDRNLG
jgi:acetyl esterase/lipase